MFTFIISKIVLSTMRVMMKYSKGVDSTILQSRYFNPTRSSGMYLSKGVALMAKSMQDFWNEMKRSYSFPFLCFSELCKLLGSCRSPPLPIRTLPALEM